MQDKLPEVTLIVVASTFIILILTGLIIFSLFIHQKRKFHHQQETIKMKDNFEQELLRSQFEIQSQAFQSISRELHDNVGTLISIAMVHIKSLPESQNEQYRQKITEADSLLNEAMETLRDISRSINPDNINRLGWRQSFMAELEKIRKTNLFSIHYVEEGEPFLIELPKQIILFRILQETLNNIIKHSSGCNIHAHLVFLKPQIKITIKDDGEGFDPTSDHLSAQGSGIKNMQERAAMLPANLEIESRQGFGTSVKISYNEQPT